MRDLFLTIILVLILALIFMAIRKRPESEEKRKAEEERKKAVHERKRWQKILSLQLRFKKKCDWVYSVLIRPGYLILFGSFVSGAFALGLHTDPINSKEDLVAYFGYFDGVILVFCTLVFKKPIEFIQILRDFAPKLREWVYGDRMDIDDKIKATKSTIARLNWRISELDTAIAA